METTNDLKGKRCNILHKEYCKRGKVLHITYVFRIYTDRKFHSQFFEGFTQFLKSELT